MAPPKKTVLVIDEPQESTPVPEAAVERGEGREKTVATLTHVLGLVTLFLGPLVMYFVYRRKASPWLRAHLDEAVNYHILVVAAVLLLTVLAVVFTTVNLSTIALVCFLLVFLVITANVVFSVLAIIWAARGKSYHFPLDVKIVR
ncbi:MAG: DUF4870 domain-containing protein [Candidatus Thermoplasmatota archaeon]